MVMANSTNLGLGLGLGLGHGKKLDGLGPVDNRPSTNYLDHFVPPKKLHLTCDTWHVTRDT